MFFQKLSVVGEPGKIVALDFLQRIAERHFSEVVMMAVTLPVGGDVNQLRTFALVGKTTHESVRESLAVAQKTFEGDRLGNRTIVEEKVDAFPRRQFGEIGAGRIDAAVAYVVISSALPGTNALGLARRQNRESDSVFSENFERFDVDRGFGQPHSFRTAAEAAFEILNSPLDLCDLIAAIGQWKNHVVVALREGRAMAGKMVTALPVRFQNRCVHATRLIFHPGEKGRTEIETDSFVVIDQLDDAIFRIKNARGGIGRITLRRDALVPVVIWISGILELDGLEIRVLAGRLVEVTVDADVFHAGSVFA